MRKSLATIWFCAGSMGMLPAPALCQSIIKTMVVAHAGGAAYHAHNTRSAILHALDVKADIIEFDVQDTKDHIPVLHHDFVLQPDETQQNHHWLDKRTTFIRNLTFAELSNYSIGQSRSGSPSDKPYPFRKNQEQETIINLDNALELISKSPNNPQVFVEVKSALDLPAGYPAETLAIDILKIIHKHAAKDKISIISFDWKLLHLIHTIDPTQKTVYIFRDPLVYAREFANDMRGLGIDITSLTPQKIIDRLTDGFGPVSNYSLYADYIKKQGGWMLDAYKDDATLPLVSQAQKIGLKTGVWTVDTLTETSKAVALGINAITTNYPDVIVAALRPSSVQ
ncbi:glycerophosphoryl diester phosphodiesterase [Acetobacter indonesiensis NRIC 0313]|uniref:Glycerophosphoryl diester phosphodiesterase n=1 Tax=Acetobacter indonesiensis TaxID=104101 RepID=A0A6N3T9E2_9PROT|nr:glycerophosphodiester phosphodiesterase family protein [Acetobacter indonesiensis]GAN64472.1 glycerophosphoryl diester phosphodiesterase [Acetobacter indonesiensis]GBQ55236.1 glycerophosphoryl diester phosphodiesterase [Acetobacter indonesiensis NRIC 0313]GEN04229.1 hypothetical protein AIN02nite_22540 [Acetobacter indonesiensis]